MSPDQWRLILSLCIFCPAWKASFKISSPPLIINHFETGYFRLRDFRKLWRIFKGALLANLEPRNFANWAACWVFKRLDCRSRNMLRAVLSGRRNNLQAPHQISCCRFEVNLLPKLVQPDTFSENCGVHRSFSLHNLHSSLCLMTVAAGRIDFHLQAHTPCHGVLWLVSRRRIYALDVGHDIAVGRLGFGWPVKSLYHTVWFVMQVNRIEYLIIF